MKLINLLIISFSILLIIGCSFQGKQSCKSDLEEVPEAMADRWSFVGEAVNEPGYDIWGSSPVKDDDGNIHLFSARWPQSVPWEKGWRYHSEIAHYVGDSPKGPFHFKEVLGKGKGDGYWNAVGFHNPNIKKIDNKYVLVYISNDGAPKHGPNQRIGMMISESLDGPWKEIPNKTEPILAPPLDSTVWCFNSGCGVNNPALIKKSDGRYFLYFKAMTGPRPHGRVRMGLAIASKLEGPYIIQKNPITANDQAIEDGYAFMWRDHICLLTTDNHGILERGGGLLWVSKDGVIFKNKPLAGFHHFGNVYLNGSIPKSANVRYTKEVKFERPQILMDESGNPEYLYCPSGVAIDGSDGANCYVMEFK